MIATAAFALYHERIICAEEAFLEEKFGATYAGLPQSDDAEETHTRLLNVAGR